MSWQKCPICDGSGKEYMFGQERECSVCKGTKIISTLNGKPPESDKVSRKERRDELLEEYASSNPENLIDPGYLSPEQLLAEGICPCGSESSVGCSVTWCPLYLKEKDGES